MKRSSDKPTERQEKALRVIYQYITEKGYPPSIRELGAELDIASNNGVRDHINRLQAKGLLTYDILPSGRMVSRTFSITAKGFDILEPSRSGEDLPENEHIRPSDEELALRYIEALEKYVRTLENTYDFSTKYLNDDERVAVIKKRSDLLRHRGKLHDRGKLPHLLYEGDIQTPKD